MKATGIIAEWNPFHNGHAYHLQQTRQNTKADAIVVVMSGNYTQRGEPAITSKWHRAQAGLLYGADIVVELPFWFATQPADVFAYGGVSILNALGCNEISFGVETDYFSDYDYLARWIVNHPHEVKVADAELTNFNASFAEKNIAVIEKLKSQYEELSNLKVSFNQSSNSLLGFAYVKAIETIKSKMTVSTVKRIGVDHNQLHLKQDLKFASGSALRQEIIKGSSANILSNYMPSQLTHILQQQQQYPTLEILYPMIRYLLLVQSAENLRSIYQIHEGIEHRLIKLAQKCEDYKTFISQAKHRSWPEPRIRRTLLMVALQITEQELNKSMDNKQPMFLLGATTQGRKYLKTIADIDDSKWQLVSRANKKTKDNWPMWFKTDKIYQEYLLQHRQDENFGRPPLFI